MHQKSCFSVILSSFHAIFYSFRQRPSRPLSNPQNPTFESHTQQQSRFSDKDQATQPLQRSLLRITMPSSSIDDNTAQSYIPPYLQIIMDQQMLDSYQRKAVTMNPDAPLIIFAGAGAGKTRTMSTRITYLLSRTLPSSILAITV